MSKPVGFFTGCPQGEALVLLFGDYDLARLPQIDQAALLAILGKFVYENEAFASSYADRILLSEAASDAIKPDYDKTTDAIQAALTVLENISKEDAIALIQFLTQ